VEHWQQTHGQLGYDGQEVLHKKQTSHYNEQKHIQTEKASSYKPKKCKEGAATRPTACGGGCAHTQDHSDSKSK